MPQYHASYIRNNVGTKVVSIYGENFQGNTSGGTGFHVKAKSGKTYIATNGHICRLADEYDNLEVHNGSVVMKRRVVYRHPTHDLCLVEAIPNSEGLSIGSKPQLGEITALVGHPALRPLSIARGEIIGNRRISLIFGFNMPESHCIGKYFDREDIEQRLRLKEKVSKLELSLLIYMYNVGANNTCLATGLPSKMLNGISYGGNSGSPVVNFWGNVVGVLYAGGRQVTDSYVVPLRYLKNMLEMF